tara:strand:+ start:533 stop:1393 length:861 start_codon:yes stop_codon:yes gene_type:complete
MAKYSEMTYAQALRKEPTNYKLRAMGKRRYDLKYRKDDKGKTTVKISTKDDPKKYPSYSEQAKSKGKSSSKSLLNRKGSGTQQTNYDDIRKPGQVGTPSGEKARESQSADAKKGGKNTVRNILLGPALTGAFAKIAVDANKIGKKNVIIAKDGRPKLLEGPRKQITDRSKTMNVDKKGNVTQGNNKQEAKKDAPKKDSKKDKAKKVARNIVKKAKSAGKTVASKAKSLFKFRKFLGGPPAAVAGIALGSTQAGATARFDNMVKKMSVAELKKMGLSDAQIKKIKGK